MGAEILKFAVDVLSTVVGCSIVLGLIIAFVCFLPKKWVL